MRQSGAKRKSVEEGKRGVSYKGYHKIVKDIEDGKAGTQESKEDLQSLREWNMLEAIDRIHQSTVKVSATVTLL